MSVETYKKQIIDLRARLDREKEAKKKDNEYYFIGLFAVESLKNATEGIGYVKKYKRISDCYEVKE